MPNTDLVILSKPRSAAAEAYRTLRTNLTFGNAQNPIDTLLVTSTSEADEKSVTLANLAVSFAQGGHRTILVDTDLRRPSQHEIWGVDNTRGLSTMTTDAVMMADPPLIQTEIENLSVLPSGPVPEVPADLLSSMRMDEAIGILKARAEYILFDAPPVLVASDATLLASKLDGVLLVIRSGHTRRDTTERAKHNLEQVGARLLGAVLTNAPRVRGERYGG
jgi:non-specific protein-tyrosine kinase